MSLNDDNIAKDVESIKKSAVNLIESSSDDETGLVDMMSICRRLTFRATLSTFFGIEVSDYSAMGINELEYINAVVNYFKAWEYFLLRPQTHWDRTLVRKHSIAVSELQRHVRCMLKSIVKHCSAHTSERCLFIDQLHRVHAHHPESVLVQSVLEMMIAGVDTSSVTAYYSILGLSSDQSLQEELRHDIAATIQSTSKSKLLRSVIDETLRFKPVGPVVLREVGDTRSFYFERCTLIHLLWCVFLLRRP